MKVYTAARARAKTAAQGIEAHCGADMFAVEESGIVSELLAAWTFKRLEERLVIHREVADDGGLQLFVNKNGRARAFRFSSADRLMTFQNDMEAFLVRTGWSLEDFAPDRRRADRRGFPRITNDRRRWWTDVWPYFKAKVSPHARI